MFLVLKNLLAIQRLFTDRKGRPIYILLTLQMRKAKFPLALAILLNLFGSEAAKNMKQTEYQPLQSVSVTKQPGYSCEQTGGKNVTHFDCPVIYKKQQVYSMCTKRNLTTIPNNLPQNTTVLCLQGNLLKSLNKYNFSIFNQLRSLNLSQNFELSELQNDVFSTLQRLQYLDLASMNVSVLKSAVVSAIPGLLRLRLANWTSTKNPINHLKLHWLNGVVNSSIDTLDLTGINRASASGVFWELRHPLFHQMKYTHLKYLWLSNNQIITIRKGVFSNFPNLVRLWLDHNILMGGDAEVVLQDFPKMKSLQNLDISHQNYVDVAYQPVNQSKAISNLIFDSRFHNSSCTFIELPPNLKVVYMGYSNIVLDINIDNLCVKDNNSLSAIHAEKIFMKHVYNGSMRYLPHLKYLDLHGSKMALQSKGIFKHLHNLVTLNISRLYLNWWLQSKEEWLNLAENMNMTKLQKLDLSGNYVSGIPDEFFQTFPSLERLWLSHNLLVDIPQNLTNLSNISMVDLSFNHLRTVPFKIMKEWQNATLNVNFTGNDLLCTCADTEQIKIAQDSKQNLTLTGYNCTYLLNGGKMDIYQINLDQMRDKCGQNLTFLKAFWVMYLLALCLILFSVSVYRWRFKLQFVLYYTKQSKFSSASKNPQDNITYDFYLCCHTDDLTNIEKIYKTLEEQNGYAAFISERDALIGKTIADCILDAFNCSRNIILVISHKLVRGTFFQYTVYLSQKYRDRYGRKIVCLFLNNYYLQRSELLPATLQYLISTSLCLSWSDLKQQEQLFWMRLKQYLGTPLNKADKLMKTF